LFVLADLRLSAERGGAAGAKRPFAALAVGGAHVAVDHEAPVDVAHVRRRAVHGEQRPQQQIAGLHLAGHDVGGVQARAAQLFIRGLPDHDRAIIGQSQIAQPMASGNHAQCAVGRALPVDGEAGVERAALIIEFLDVALAKSRVLMEAIKGVLRSRRLPVQLVRDLFDVRPEEWLEHREVFLTAAHALHERADPGGPVRLQHHAAARLRIVEHFEQQIVVAVRGVMLESLLVQTVDFGGDLGRFGGR